jgi:hypothetical protein
MTASFPVRRTPDEASELDVLADEIRAVRHARHEAARAN